jgi:cytochrome c oxidase subunit II
MRLLQIVTVALLIAPQDAGYSAATGARGWQHGTGEVREFSVVARRFEFVPDRLEVDEGDRVRITVHTEDGTHGLEIRQFDVREKITRRGGPVTIEFDATEAGTFEIRCSEYCGRGHSRMKGALVVRGNGGSQ